MKFTISRSALNEAIQRVAKAVSPRTTLPILAGIKVEASSDAITLTASDTTQCIQSRIPLESETAKVGEVESTGRVVLPAKFLTEIIKKLPKDEVKFEVGDQRKTSIISGNSEVEVAGLDAEEFPELPSIRSIATLTIPAEQLREMIKSTKFAVSTNESTPILQGVLMELYEGELRFTATDRHRMAKVAAPIDSELQYSNIVISAKHLDDLSKVMPDKQGTVEMAVADGWALFRLEGVLFYSRLLDGTFPDTSKIIPTEFQTAIKVDTQTFQDAIERAHLISREEKTNIVRLFIESDGSAVISSAVSQLGKVAEDLQTEMIGKPIKVAFNSLFMLDALKVIDTPDVSINFTGPMSPIIVKPVGGADVLHLILPYRTAD